MSREGYSADGEQTLARISKMEQAIIEQNVAEKAQADDQTQRIQGRR